MAISTRGDVLKLLGVPLTEDKVPARNADGSHPLKRPCPECGGRNIRIEWDAGKKLGGSIRHMGDDDIATCGPLSIAELINALPADEPAPVEAKPTVVTPAVLTYAHSDADLDMVMFVNPVDFPVSGVFTSGGLKFWSKRQHGVAIGCVRQVDNKGRETGWFVLTKGNDIRKVPYANVAYVSEKVTCVH